MNNPFEHVPKEGANPYDESVEQHLKSLTARKAELAEQIEDATEETNGELVQKLEAELKLVERDLALAEAKLQGIKGGYDWSGSQSKEEHH